jgi:two-component system sensor histidine kinase CpxA
MRLDPRRSLLAKTVGWFLLSVTVIITVAALILGAQVRFGDDSPVWERFGGQAAAAMLLHDELSATPYGYWDDVFARYGEAYSAAVTIGLPDGTRIAGADITLPDELRAKLRESEQDTLSRGNRRGMGRRFRRLMDERGGADGYSLPPLPDGMKLRFAYLGRTPEGYWAGFRVPVVVDPDRPPVSGFILARSDSITGGGLFFNPLPWIIAFGSILLLSAALWIPFVRGITVPLSRMTKAAESIAGGRFDTRVDGSKLDEIGRLGEALNIMSAQLNDYMKGRKRFLGDIAHELASPIARMELGLEILKGKVTENETARVAGVAEEVRHMSALVEELLSFTRAEIGAGKISMEAVSVRQILDEVASRDGEGADVRVDCEEGLSAYGDEGLIRRAVSNLLRNAVKYAGSDGLVTLSGVRRGQTVSISVTDSGQGVPPGQAAMLFEPFYRTDSSRTRETGGVGLGLAIVKTCAAACGGTVRARNVKPRGFEVTIGLRAGNV